MNKLFKSRTRFHYETLPKLKSTLQNQYGNPPTRFKHKCFLFYEAAKQDNKNTAPGHDKMYSQTSFIRSSFCEQYGHKYRIQYFIQCFSLVIRHRQEYDDVGGGSANAPQKVLICQKFEQNSLKVGQNLWKSWQNF